MKYLLVFLCASFFAADDATNFRHHLLWEPDRKLRWSDFQGPSQARGLLVAETHSGMKLIPLKTFYDNDEVVQIRVEAYFNKKKSWVSPRGRTAYTLAHEQLHFDITALFAYELEKKVNGLNLTIDEYNREVGNLHGDFQKKCQNYQFKYDEATEHGMKKDAQMKWHKHINKMLAKRGLRS